MSTPRILAFSGSLRADSYNQRILGPAAAAAEAAGAEVTTIRLADYPLPVYDQDLEGRDGLPEAAIELKARFAEHHGLLIACPEYNSSITAALKNAIDWVSRPHGDEPPLAAFSGKLAALLSASPGALGGLRGLWPVRSILSSIQVTVIATQAAVPKVHEVLGDDGTISDERLRGGVERVGRDLAQTLAKVVD